MAGCQRYYLRGGEKHVSSYVWSYALGGASYWTFFIVEVSTHSHGQCGSI